VDPRHGDARLGQVRIYAARKLLTVRIPDGKEIAALARSHEVEKAGKGEPTETA
jgi:hypothetical protein